MGYETDGQAPFTPVTLADSGRITMPLRPTWVRRAFAQLSGMPTRLQAFSDDMDGLRKVPDNVPNQAMLAEHLGKPLTRIPDPFGKYESFAHHNNAMLREFLDRFGFDYEFVSASDRYNSGQFDDALPARHRAREPVVAVELDFPAQGEHRGVLHAPHVVRGLEGHGAVDQHHGDEVLQADVGDVAVGDGAVRAVQVAQIVDHDAAEERRHHVGHALGDELHVGAVPAADHAVGHHRRQQRLDAAQHRDCKRRAHERPHRFQ